MSAPLRLPVRDWRPEPSPVSRFDPRLTVSVAVSILTAGVVFTVGVLVGGRLKEGTQLGLIAGMVVRGPMIDSLADSSRATLERFDRATRPHKRPPAPLGQLPTAATAKDTAHLPHPNP